MTKKISVLMLTILLVFNFSIIANANTKDNGVNYGMNESFVMTIPAVISFDSNKETLTIHISENYLNDGNQLIIKFRSLFDEEGTPGVLINISDSSKKVRYNIRDGSFIFGSNSSWTVASSGQFESTGSVDVYLVDEKISAGIYYDILTFITDVVPATK